MVNSQSTKLAFLEWATTVWDILVNFLKISALVVVALLVAMVLCNLEKIIFCVKLPGDSRSWESPEKEDNVWWLFIQIFLHQIPNFSPRI